MSAAQCACIAEKAAEMNDRQQALVAAMVMKNIQLASQLQLDMPMPDLAAAGNFMASVPMQCAGQ